MKIVFDGFVPYPHSQNYKCSRGCSWCSSSERMDIPVGKLDTTFYEHLWTFLEKNNVEYSSISLNFCWDFLLRSSFFLESLRVLIKYNILRAGIKILLYTNAISVEKLPKNLKILEKFQWYLTFQIGLSLHFSGDEASLSRQLDTLKGVIPILLSYHHVQAHIVIQRSATIEHLSEQNQKKLEDICRHFPSTLAENEGVYISYDLLVQSLSWPIGIQKCPYLEPSNINITEDNFSFYMLDISHEWMRPHGPWCEKNKNLFIGNLSQDISELRGWAQKLVWALKKMQNDYDNWSKQVSLCQFCRKHIGTYMNHS